MAGHAPNSWTRLPSGRQLVIRYAVSDYATTFATLSLDEVLSAMEQAEKRRGALAPRLT